MDGIKKFRRETGLGLAQKVRTKYGAIGYIEDFHRDGEIYPNGEWTVCVSFDDGSTKWFYVSDVTPMREVT